MDGQVLPRRIKLARKAIKARVNELLCTGENSETARLIEALNVLDNLVSMHRSAKPNVTQH